MIREYTKENTTERVNDPCRVCGGEDWYPQDGKDYFITLYIGDNDFLDYLIEVRKDWIEEYNIPIDTMNDIIFIDKERHLVYFHLSEVIPLGITALNFYLEDLGIMGEILTSSGMKEVFLEGEHYKAMNTFHIVCIRPIKRL